MQFPRLLAIGLVWTSLLWCGGPASAQYSSNISGRWVGYWYNTNGNRGPDLLRVREYANGRLTGVWGDGDDLYYIQGRQTGWGRYFWQARSNGYHYRAWASLSNNRDEMRIRYTVTHFDDGRWQEYGGWSNLTRSSYYGGRYDSDYYDYDRYDFGYGYRNYYDFDPGYDAVSAPGYDYLYRYDF
jgi:hypothetical protein